MICIRFKPESKILLLMEMCKERILNSSTARCLWLAEKYKEAKFIKLKYYHKLVKNQMSKQEMLVDKNIVWH